MGNLLLFVIPPSYTGLRILDLYGMFAGMALAQIMSGIVGLIWLKRVLANHTSSARSITRRNSGIAVFWKDARKATRAHYFPLIIRDIWEKVTKKWLGYKKPHKYRRGF